MDRCTKPANGKACPPVSWESKSGRPIRISPSSKPVGFKASRPENINALATALDLDSQDLFALAGYRVPDGLPTLVPYMRTKYGDELPEAAIQEINGFYNYLRSKYDVDGPIDDENEEPDAPRRSRS